MINNVAIDHIFQVKTNQDLKLLGYAQICSGSEGVKIENFKMAAKTGSAAKVETNRLLLLQLNSSRSKYVF